MVGKLKVWDTSLYKTEKNREHKTWNAELGTGSTWNGKNRTWNGVPSKGTWNGKKAELGTTNIFTEKCAELGTTNLERGTWNGRKAELGMANIFTTTNTKLIN